MDTERALEVFRRRLEGAGLCDEALRAFEHMYGAYRRGETGKVAWEEVVPPSPEDLVEWDALGSNEFQRSGHANLGRLIWIVLNGGLGTSMKLDRAKSIVPVKDGLSFLDLIAQHVLALRRSWKRELPVLFMNSFATRDDTLASLAHYPLAVALRGGQSLPPDFLQHRFPRIREADGSPFGDPKDDSAWAPPGHGNLYLALRCSGALKMLLESGVRWAFVSNADNLGASPHPLLLGYMSLRGFDFLMEVTPKTAADVKGGTLVRRDRTLELLEIAQVPAEHLDDFQDTRNFPAFNTNNVWVDLEALDAHMDRGSLDLPIIVNRKRVGDTQIVQLESAMGAAIALFPRAGGVLVPRSRFAPVKTTDDLLVRRSDAYIRGDDSPLAPNPARDPSLGPPRVRLDPLYYGSVPDLDLRIPHPPSLLRTSSLEVFGDVRFGRDVVVEGDVRVRAEVSQQLYIEDGSVLSG